MEGSAQWLRTRGFPVGSAYLCEGVKEGAQVSKPTSTQPAAHSGGAAPYSGLAEPEVATRASHDTSRGAYSKRKEKRKEVVMAAPELEVLSPSTVPGEAWGPELGELWGPVSLLPVLLVI